MAQQSRSKEVKLGNCSKHESHALLILYSKLIPLDVWTVPYLLAGWQKRPTTLFIISEFSDDIDVFRQNNVPNIEVIKTNHVPMWILDTNIGLPHLKWKVNKSLIGSLKYAFFIGWQNSRLNLQFSFKLKTERNYFTEPKPPIKTVGCKWGDDEIF